MRIGAWGKYKAPRSKIRSASKAIPSGKWRTNVYLALSLLLLVGIGVYSALRGQAIYLRLFESIRDLGFTFAHFFNPSITPTVTQFSYNALEEFPRIWSDVTAIATAFGQQFISKENFLQYLYTVAINSRWVLVSLLILSLFVALFMLLVFLSIRKSNTDHAENSKPLKCVLWLDWHVTIPIRRFLKGWWIYLKTNKFLKRTLIVLLLLHLNVFTVVLEFAAYYLYFILPPFDFDLQGLLTQVLKLVWDAYLVLRLFPWYVWVPIGLWVFDKWRKRIGYQKLYHEEDRLREFILLRAIVFMICAPMREGKTTLLTSIMMSLEKIFRQQAKDALFEIEMRFPEFPWQHLEQFIQRGVRKGLINNHEGLLMLLERREWLAELLAASSGGTSIPGAREFRRWMQSKFGKIALQPLFGYDVSRFPAVYDDALGGETIQHAVSDYAQLFFIYAHPSSLIIGNYNIRLDDDYESKGNFPRWRDDFFDNDPTPIERSMNAHVLNQDMLRIGRRKDPEGRYVNALEFGAVAQTEIGKERGNQYDTKKQHADDPECNQTSDLYNMNLKMFGHKATIRNIPFIRFGCDEQRPENWGADARDLCDIITITDKSSDKLMMPFFAFGEALYRVSTWMVKKVYGTYRYERGDNTLMVYLMKKIYGAILGHYTRITNTFGGYDIRVVVASGMKVDEKGNTSGTPTRTSKGKLFISRKKVYSGRFDTAAWRMLYARRTKTSFTGLNDVPTYEGLAVSEQNMIDSKSHFFDRVMPLFSEPQKPIPAPKPKQEKPAAKEDPKEAPKKTSAKAAPKKTKKPSPGEEQEKVNDE